MVEYTEYIWRGNELSDFYSAIAAFAGGLLVAFIDSIITKKAFGNEQKLVRLLPLRTVAAALLMTLLYFICAEAGLNTTVVIISAATGVTLGLLVFTMLLIKEQKKDKGE